MGAFGFVIVVCTEAPWSNLLVPVLGGVFPELQSGRVSGGRATAVKEPCVNFIY